MEKKGLCVNCDYFDGCALPSRLPVWHCQEFSSAGSSKKILKKNNLKKKAKKGR